MESLLVVIACPDPEDVFGIVSKIMQETGTDKSDVDVQVRFGALSVKKGVHVRFWGDKNHLFNLQKAFTQKGYLSMIEDMSKKEVQPKQVVIIISKLDWARLQKKRIETLRIYTEGELHREFGDSPEDDIVRVIITRK